MISLLKTRRFLPLFLTQSLSALNDNLFKNAVVILLTYQVIAESSYQSQTLVTLAAALFILPFFLFSATAGQLADKYDRGRLTFVLKGIEVFLMGLAAYGFLTHSYTLLLVTLFGAGVQAAFFGPIKYALLPRHLKEHELLAGNAYIEAGTFLAILLGSIGGGLLILMSQGSLYLSFFLIGLALLTLACSSFIPKAPALSPHLKIEINIFKETFKNLQGAATHKNIFLAILGCSWFWFVGALLLSQLPHFTKEVLHGEGILVSFFFGIFAVGIGIGSFLSNKLLRGIVQSTYVPIAAFGMGLFLFDLSSLTFPIEQVAYDILGFLSIKSHWRILGDLLGLSIAAGVYIVPLYAYIQKEASPQELARLIAANNIMNSLFMVLSALFSIVFIKLGFSIKELFLGCAGLTIGVACYITKLLPDALMRSLARAFFTFLYRVELKGLENYKKAGDRVLIVANHLSFIDAALIAAYIPDKLTFAINTYIAQKWWVKPFLHLVDVLPLDPRKPMSLKTLIELLEQNIKCMIFPEGRITDTGSLMKIYEGPGMVADRAAAKILPIRIEGAQYTAFSRLKGKVRLRWFPKITLTFLPPEILSLPEEVRGRKRRDLIAGKLYDLMANMIFNTSPYQETLFKALIEAQNIFGKHTEIIEDAERRPLTYRKLIRSSLTLGRRLKHLLKEPYIGILLPNTVSTVVTFFSLQAFKKVPALLNFTLGPKQLLSACQVANLKAVITSRQFIEQGRLEALIKALEEKEIQIFYLEDIRPLLTLRDKAFGLFFSYFLKTFNHFYGEQNPASPAVILFTSGSEGTPKGVALSHQNIQANRFQLASRIDFTMQDKVFNCLPMFHAFGLTAGTLLPLLSGIKTFYYPSPLHYRIVPELIYDTNSTIFFSTDTFLAGYLKFAHPYDFYSVRYIFAGAEKIKEETKQKYMEKFGVRILEGYGATEASPVIAINTPMYHKEQSVGKLLPAIDPHLKKVEGIEEGEDLCVKGPNIMLGYFLEESPGILQPLKEGLYDTGDIVEFDSEGFLFIKGRAKRFAKIGGEMISLAQVESSVARLWPGFLHAILSVPHASKGEHLILLTNYLEATKGDLVKHFKEQGLPTISIPKEIIFLPQMPLLGIGKIDYQAAKKIALEKVSNN